jgi:hypothetical protein
MMDVDVNSSSDMGESIYMFLQRSRANGRNSKLSTKRIDLTDFTVQFQGIKSFDTLFLDENQSINHRKYPRRQEGFRALIPGTGRIAFGSNVDQLSEIYKVLGKDSLNRPRNGADDGADDIDKIHKLDKLQLDGDSNKPQKQQKTGNSSSNKTNNSQQSSGKSANHVNKTNNNNNPNKSTPINSNNTNSSTPVQSLAKTNAKAKMAAMGIQWAEEEELPGFSAPKTSSITATGNLNSDVNKQFNNSMQRQKKVIIAKKK